MLSLALLSAFAGPFTTQDPPPVEPVTVLALERTLTIEKAFVERDHLWVAAAALSGVNGFALKPEGLCADEICVPVPSAESGASWTQERAGETFVDATAFAEHVGQPFTRSEDGGVWSFAPVPLLANPLLTGQAPDFELLDREGNAVRLSDFRGSKVLLLTWASW